MRRIYNQSFIVFLMFVSLTSRAQTFEAWAENVNWDGIMHWSEYLIFSPKFSGPNAMPVPQISDGKVQNQSFVRLGGQYQARRGDQTVNPTIYAGHTFLKDKVSVDVFIVPIEFFNLSNERKVERNVYFEHFDINHAIGDLYINTNIQALTEERNGVDAALRIGLKTASSGLDNPARFIDSPGYYFDISVGKTFSASQLSIRPYTMLGFFAWQTNDESLRQNDAFLYGLGINVSNQEWSFDQSLRGYSGYHDIGDRPLLISSVIQRKLGQHSVLIEYEYGIRDFLYQGIEVSFQYNFKSL